MSVLKKKLGRDAIEHSSVDELRQLQLERLRWSLNHAYRNVAHYKKAFDMAGVHPDELNSLSDLARFPFTTKQDLRDNYPFGMLAVPREQVSRIHASSGTTGKPTVVAYTAHDISVWADLMARSMWAGGARPGDIAHIAYGYGLFTGGLGAHYGAERLGCTVVPMSGGQTEKQVQLIQDFRPDVIMVTPSYFCNLLDEMDRVGINPHDSSLRIGIFGAEPWTDRMRSEIETRAHINAVDIYGLSELMGPGVAMECVESKDGPVVWEDHFFPEIIDPVTGDPVSDGEPGELVFTSLSKEAMPIIRYRTRDLTKLLAPTSRSMRRIGKITGRSDDMLIIRGVNLFPTQVEEQVLQIPQLASHYQLVVSRQGNMDTLQVLAELRPEFDLFSDTERQAVIQQLGHAIKVHIGVTATIDLRRSGEIERTLTGKARRVVDLRRR
ncbi:phenylacetate--CoA ligase [Paenalcaligenes niemegkensis]|uniref:phenylacetate--CoA ligase PaaK n=1 Tax=Paenalcaligenes niemegkensis TaxID=2895469 RepID=UPI001EE9137F|nr:phenylacetate--CoA ligase PaaK [Paenalcaligenes niemegkensis]MCQ9616773.1 phenylacetate--CoA ligase [Paenalcaligenes niemegkensis]